MIYEELIKEYNNLTDQEQKALLIYKSRVGKAINSINNDEEEIINIYHKYKRLLNNPKNIFIAKTVFKNISFDTLESFRRSLILVYQEICKVANKFILPEDITVYRALSIADEKDLCNISKTNLISTSLDINECSKFLINQKGYYHYLYQINLKKGSKVAICPYSILLDERDERLILTQRKDQHEIILLKNNYNFDINLSTNIDSKGLQNLNIIIVNATDNRDFEYNIPIKK